MKKINVFVNNLIYYRFFQIFVVKYFFGKIWCISRREGSFLCRCQFGKFIYFYFFLV